MIHDASEICTRSPLHLQRTDVGCMQKLWGAVCLFHFPVVVTPICFSLSSRGTHYMYILPYFILFLFGINLRLIKTLYNTCSPMDPLQWMGPIRMRVQTGDKNITIIHKQSTWLHVVIVINPSLRSFFTSNKSSIHYIASPVKKLSRLNQERNMYRSSTKGNSLVLNSYKQIYQWVLMWEDNRGIDI